jgi:catechol 2,3-dioxygenase-like lactoylglutathione lyase family enzyme
MKISAVRIWVRDIAAAKAFYQDQLGLTLVNDMSAHGVCVFNMGGAVLVVEVADEQTSAEEGGLLGRLTGISFETQDIHAEVARLKARGVTFDHAPEQQYWGGWLAWFKDPSGNTLELVQNP